MFETFRAQTCLCILSLLGLSVVGCVNEDENPTFMSSLLVLSLHVGVYVLDIPDVFPSQRIQRSVLVLTLCSVLTKVRFMSSVSLRQPPEILEWLDAW